MPNNNNATQTIPLTFAYTTVNASVKEFVAGAGIPSSATITAISGTTITISQNATATTASNNLAFFWLESALLKDSSWTGVCDGTGFCRQGNGNWNCSLYWAVNHSGVAAPSGCSSNPPTISRYQVYRYEIANSLITAWSGNHSANTSGNSGNGENGSPLCAAANGVSGIDTSVSSGTDRRNLIVPVINCLAQNVSGQGSNATVPAAAFAKYFLSQPWLAESTYLYGEMTGLVVSGDKISILNQVQLYR
jgi:hypothetical protein